MRLISPGANPPSDMGKYLLPHEQEVITVRKHPAVLLAPVAWAALGLIAAALLSTTLFRHSSTLTWIVWAAWGLVFLRLLWAAANWAVDYFVITSHRFVETSGLFSVPPTTFTVLARPVVPSAISTFIVPWNARSPLAFSSSW